MDDFRLGLGHVALDFVATLGRRAGQPVEKLTEPADLTRWLTEAGLLDADHAGTARPTARRLADALALREATYRILVAARGILAENRRRRPGEPPCPRTHGSAPDRPRPQTDQIGLRSSRARSPSSPATASSS